jgi:putative ABC transport system permease protein
MARIRHSLRSWLWRVDVHQEVDEEIAFHIEMRTRELIERGVDPKTAREIVLARVGDTTRLKRTCVDLGRRREREMRITQWLDEFRHDARFAVRQLKASPGFTLVAVITLALGIGANSAMFALADVTLIRPLPYPEPHRLMMVWEQTATRARRQVSPLNLRDWTAANHTFETLGAVAASGGGGPLLAAPDGTVEIVERQIVTTHFFDVLGVVPVVGRTFRSSDETVSPTVFVMSEGLWRTRFGGDPMIVGRTVRLNGQPFTVVGVIPDSVRFSRPARIWTLAPLGNMTVLPRQVRALEVIGRLKPGVTEAAARADLSTIANRLSAEFPAANKGVGVFIEPLRDGLMGPDLQITSLFLIGVVGFVLLMCCANVANLLLARASVRTREIAVRAALGAGRARIVRQLLTESLVLSAIGGALGMAIGAAILRAAPALIPSGLLPPAAVLVFDGRVVVFGLAAAGFVGVVFGLAPAWHARRTAVAQSIGHETRSTTRGGRRFRHLLAAGEVASAALLLFGAGLLLRSLLVLTNFDTGYRAPSDSVQTLNFSVPVGKGTRYTTPTSLLTFFAAVERDTRALPNVRHVGWGTSLPYGTSELGPWSFEIVGAPPVDPNRRPTADYAAVTPGYFRTLDLPVVAGRVFDDTDRIDSTPVCVVNEAFARRYLAGRPALGARIAFRSVLSPAPVVREVVGVARQVKGRPEYWDDGVQVYVPLAQQAGGEVFMVVQPSTGPAEALTPLVRSIVARHDPNLSVRGDRTLQALSEQATASYRFRATMGATFASLALLLALVGVFGVLAYSVEQRWREFGVRIALGATPGSVLRLVAGSAARVVAVGGIAGLAGAAALSRTISTFLFRVEPLDPMTFVSVAVLLTLTAIMAMAAPAWRATRVDPIVAFRSE